MCEYPLAEWVQVDRSEVLLRGLLVDIVFLVFLFLLPVDVRGDATVLLWEPWGVLYAQVLVCLVVMLPDVDINTMQKLMLRHVAHHLLQALCSFTIPYSAVGI